MGSERYNILLDIKSCQMYFKESEEFPKSVVVKPFTSTDVLNRAQINWIDMSDQNLDVILSADENTSNRLLFIYYNSLFTSL